MAVAHQLVERAQRFLDRRGGVETVDLVEVDVVELQPLQAGLDTVEDVAARGAACVRAGAHFAENLGRDDHAVAWHLQVFQGLAGDLFRASAGVHISGIDEVDAAVDRRADQLLGITLLQRADLLPDALATAERHRAQTQFRDEKAGSAERTVAHGGGS